MDKIRKLWLLIRIALGVKLLWVLFMGPVPGWVIYGVAAFLTISAVLGARVIWCMWIRKDKYAHIVGRYRKALRIRTRQMEVENNRHIQRELAKNGTKQLQKR